MKNINFALVPILFLSISFGSCEDGINIKPYGTYVSDNFKNYKEIRETLIDTLSQWKEDSLVCTSQIFFDDAWQVDSILLFNKDSTRLFTTVNMRRIYSGTGTSDLIDGIVGVRKYKRWFFHYGAHRYISRHGLKTDIYSALSFEELSYVSHTRAMARFFKIDKEDQYFIDYDEMDNYFFKAYKSSYPNIDRIDSLILTRIAAYKKKKLDIKMIERVKEKRLNSISPTEPEAKNKSWWDKMFGKEEVGFFETEAWKNRRKG